jgi:HK97 gp10 family phage protein
VSITVIGMSETLARFAKSAAKLEATKVESERTAAESVLRAAEARVPVATGALKATLRVEERDGETLVVAGDESVDYARFVEFGPDNEPFLRPAADESTNEVTQIIGKLVGGVL